MKKKLIYETPSTTCRQVLMESEVMAGSPVMMSKGISPNVSQDGGDAFDHTLPQEDITTGWGD